jgi:addiction module HigA family antidote
VAEAAEGLGITQEALDDVLRGKSAITPEMAVRLEKAVGSSAATWLNLQSAFDLAQARARISTINIERLMPKIAS